MRLEITTFAPSLASSSAEERPMPLADQGALMKTDYEKLTKVIKTSGMALQ